MESVNYLRGLVRSWWLVLLVVVAGGAGGFLVYHHATPQYRSSIRLVVANTNRSDDPGTAQAVAASQAQSLAQFISTPPGVADAVKQAGYPATVSPAVSASADATQPFVTVDVVSTDPTLARRVADAYAVTALRTKNRLSHSSGGFTVGSLAPANDPGAPFSPNAKQDIGLGLAVGLVLGVALALLRESLNRTVRDSDELQRLVGLKVLGTVPRDMPKTLLPARTHPRSSRAEAYRQVRTSLQNASAVRPLTIAVTSATLGEGKTSVATNLAAVFSRAGHRVALVDADLRRPRVADFFELDTEVGLCEVLSGQVALDDALVRLDDGRFAILASGRIPANPSEALGSATMTAVLAELAREFEFVIVDTPPVLPVTDALVLAPHMDGVVLVARLGHTTRDRVTHAKSIVDRVNATVFGIVPNQAGKGTDSDYRYPYRYTAKRGHGPDTTPTIPTDHEIDIAPDRVHSEPPDGAADGAADGVSMGAPREVTEDAARELTDGAAQPTARAQPAVEDAGRPEPIDEPPPTWAPLDDSVLDELEIVDADFDDVQPAQDASASAPDDLAHPAPDAALDAAVDPAADGAVAEGDGARNQRATNARTRSRASRRQRARTQHTAADAPEAGGTEPGGAERDAMGSDPGANRLNYQDPALLFPDDTGWPGRVGASDTRAPGSEH